MKIQFIGTGGAFDYKNGNSSALILWKGKHILIDCGHSVYPKLMALGIAEKIDYVLITHLHDDHAGSFSTLLYYHYFFKNQKLTVLCPNEKAKKLWIEYLAFPMQTPEQFAHFELFSNLEGLQFIDTYGFHSPDMQTYAYIFTDETETLIYSGDLGDCDFLFQQLNTMNIKPQRIFHDIIFHPNIPPHSYYQKVMPYLADNKIFGYHCNHLENPADNTIPLVGNMPDLLLNA